MDSPGSYLNPSIEPKYGWISGLPGISLSMTVPNLELVFQSVLKIEQNAGMIMKDFGEGMMLLPFLLLDVAHQEHSQTQIHLLQSTLHPCQFPDHYFEILLVVQ